MILNKHTSLNIQKMHKKYKIVAEIIEFSSHVDIFLHGFNKNKWRKEKYVLILQSFMDNNFWSKMLKAIYFLILYYTSSLRYT